jgi:hypothetical protein
MVPTRFVYATPNDALFRLRRDLCQRWPAQAFTVQSKGRGRLKVLWVDQPGSPEASDVLAYAENVVSYLRHSDGYLWHVTCSHIFSATHMAVALTQAWARGQVRVDAVRGTVVELNTSPATIDLGAVPPDLLTFAQAMLSLSGITSQAYAAAWVTTGSFPDIHRHLAKELLRTGDSVAAALGFDPRDQ